MTDGILTHPIRFVFYTLPVGTPVLVDTGSDTGGKTKLAHFTSPNTGERDSFVIRSDEWSES